MLFITINVICLSQKDGNYSKPSDHAVAVTWCAGLQLCSFLRDQRNSELGTHGLCIGATYRLTVEASWRTHRGRPEWSDRTQCWHWQQPQSGIDSIRRVTLTIATWWQNAELTVTAVTEWHWQQPEGNINTSHMMTERCIDSDTSHRVAGRCVDSDSS